jgi:DNA polymerase-3 subunit delta
VAEPSVGLFWGEDEFLLRQAALNLFAARGVRATEVEAKQWRGGETADLATPSLLGERRALLVTGCQSLSDAGARELRAYLEAPSPDAVCVLTVVTRGKSPPPLAKAVQASGGLVRQVALRRQDLPKWVVERAKAREVSLTGPGATTLIGTIGEDPAWLDQSVEQLATAFPGRSIGREEVLAQFSGLGEQRVWDLCDQAFSGRLAQALVTLRSLLEARHDPILILAGIASRLRDLIRVRDLSDRVSAQEAARAAGLRFDWQLRRYRDQARRFPNVEALAELHGLVAEADRLLKAGIAGDVVLPGLVAAMAGHPEGALAVKVRVSR